MAPHFVSISLAATLMVGLFGGWLFRERTTERHWSFAVAAAIGLLLSRVSSFDKLFQNLVPASAVGWLPWVTLCVVGVQTIAHDRLRIATAFALGFAIPLRLLWGSVYLSEANLGPAILIAIAAWSVAIGFAIATSKPAAKGRLSVHVVGWALLIASSTCVIAATGSITYAVATGVIGVAVVGTLLGASRLPLQGAAVVICLIGLSVAFSEMPLPLGVLLITSALVVLYTSQEDVSAAKWSKSIQVAVQGAMLCAAVFAMSQLFVPSDPYGGYESDAGSVVGVIESVQQPRSANGTSMQSLDDSEATESMPDPFAGFDP